LSALSVATDTGIAIDAGIDTRACNHSAYHLGRVGKDGYVRARFIDTVPSADLVDVPRTCEITVALVHLQNRKVRRAPAFPVILRSSKGITSVGAGQNTLIVRVVVRSVKLSLHLSTWVVLFVATLVSELGGSIREQRCRLLSDSIAGELNRLLAKCGIAEVHQPMSFTDVRVDVDLALRN
jgi:hypothetical protein